MSLWNRLTNVFRPARVDRETEEEMESHIAEAVDEGRDPAEARRAFGPRLLRREQSRDIRTFAWLASLHADTVFGWRQLRKRTITSTAAALSLALGIGACTSAFRLIDAVLLRPLPVAHPEELYGLNKIGIGPEGRPQNFDGWAYPCFLRMREAAKGQADLVAVSGADHTDLTFGSDDDMEKAYVQYVSGWMFGSFGLRPALGRLLTASDDDPRGGHPDAVLSYDYWTRRFSRDPRVLGRTFRLDQNLYQIVGVAAKGFTGTEPGSITDMFAPSMMFGWATRDDATWTRAIARVDPGAALEPLRQKLQAVSHAFEEDRLQRSASSLPQKTREHMVNQTLVLQPAAAGISGLQDDYRRSLFTLGILVTLVLLIACANIANLMTAQAASRAREMALRVSIGAGRARLVQLVLVESALLALAAAMAGGLFAWWSAPLVVRMINPPDNPARLVLPADWRVLGFGLALTVLVTLLFGLSPALRASAVKPVSALKGGDDPHARRRSMHALIAVQSAFCCLVLFVSGLFAATFHRLMHQPVGFSTARLLTLDAVTARAQPAVNWEEVADDLRAQPGVQAAALCDWPLLRGTSSNNFISVNGSVPTADQLAYFLNVSSGWLDLMQIPLLDGRDFRRGEAAGVAIVNQEFVRRFFDGRNPLGKSFERTFNHSVLQVVGVVPDSRYRQMREPILPVAYLPFAYSTGNRRMATQATFIVRTAAAHPMAMAASLRRAVARARPRFRVSNARTQEELALRWTVRERLLATLAVFFAAVALLLAGIGLYGVLDYSVLGRRREIGIRMAVGAQAGDIARRITGEAFAMVAAGAAAGLAAGLGLARYLQALFYQVKPSDPWMLALPVAAMLAAALLAALPAVARAVRLDPVASLRAE